LLQLLALLLETLLLLAAVAVEAEEVFQPQRVAVGLVAVRAKQQICLPALEHQGKVIGAAQE
jgi:hypothetical protein